MRKGSYLIIRRAALKEDSWTYGSWRQYAAFLDDGEACCVRMSDLPAIMAMFGTCLLALAGLIVLTPLAGLTPIWLRVFALAFAGFALCGPQVVETFTGWRLCVVVLTCTRRPDGGWERDL